MQSREIYDIYAALLGYPGEDHGERVASYAMRIAGAEPAGAAEEDGVSAATASIMKFLDETAAVPQGEMEELYTRTFDINPVASLELGWHLYGEQYERGAFLVKMRQLLHRHFIEEAVELPDHMTHALLLAGRMENPEADHFAVTYLRPALAKILEGFAEVESPYKSLLGSLATFVQQQHASRQPNIIEGAVSHE